jgi:hypothetical protein
MSLLLALLAMVSSIIIVYYGLYRLLRILYRYDPIWCISFAILIAPFAYVVIQFGDLIELIWILILTPFYGLTVLSYAFADWLILYYNVAFGALAAICSLSHLGNHGRYLRNVVPVIIFTIILLDVAAMSPTVLAVTPSHSPTFQEAVQFIKSDQTNANQYLEERYTCTDFATDFFNNAIGTGYVCGYVTIYFPNGQCHAIDCFNTTDCGLIFVEPQTDSIVQLIRNQPYWDRAKYEPQIYDDKILNYVISWHAGSDTLSYSRLLLILASIGFCAGLVQSLNYHLACSIVSAITRRHP